jgi:DNA repair protein RadC
MGTIKDLPLMERPREKLLHSGARSLSNAELVAILLGSGTQKIPLMTICDALITAADNQVDQLAAMGIDQLKTIRGIGEFKAILLVAAFELGKRALDQTGQPLLLETFDQVAAFLGPFLPRQVSAGYFLVMLNCRKELLATQEFDIRENEPPCIQTIIRSALAAGAHELVICRAPFELSPNYLNREKAFIIQLDAAASMLNMGMRGLLVLDGPPT